MNDNIKTGIGYLIPATTVIAYFSSLFSEQFLVGILIVVVGMFAWFLYSYAMEIEVPGIVGNIVVVFGVLLSFSVFLNYGLDQNMFGGYGLSLEGLSGSALILFFSVLLGISFKRGSPGPHNQKTLVVKEGPISGQKQVAKESNEDYGEDQDNNPYYEDYYDDYLDPDLIYDYYEEEEE